MPTEAALTADGLGKRYRRQKRWAIRDVSVAVPEGSVAALVGPNGAGKTTLIRCFVGFERPDAGELWIHGVNPVEARDAALKLIGYVPQANSLYEEWTVDDHFRFAAIYRRTFDRERAVTRVRALGIDPSRRVGELSGGEQAQVALAIAASVRARVLLLDEPLAHLDPLARRDFLTTLKEDVRATGATVLLSSHIITDVQQACDWLIVLARGQVLLQAPIARAVSEYRTLPAAELSHEVPVGLFTGPNGERLALVHEANRAFPAASLEEVVLGHLASAPPAAS
jgi:ABC-2 type transport system ATP-binding protein